MIITDDMDFAVNRIKPNSFSHFDNYCTIIINLLQVYKRRIRFA